MNLIQSILQFWFEGVDDSVKVDQSKAPFNKWFKSDPEFDKNIQHRYQEFLVGARNGKYDSFKESAEGALALILSFDQFPRNIYRGTPNAYATDVVAQTLALEVLQNQFDESLPLIQCVFCYMPLMHAEDLNLQKLSVQCFQNLVEESRDRCPDNTAYYQWHLKYAKKNFDIIKELGYFPQRKKVFGL